MKVRMKMDVGGMFHGDPNGVRRGDVVDLDEATALRYIANEVAEPVTKSGARKAGQVADNFADEVAGDLAEDGVALVHPEDRADDLPADERALDPEAVIHDETTAYDPSVAPVPLDEPELGDGDVVDDDERVNAARQDEPNLVPQLDNDKPVKHELAEPTDEPEFVSDEDAKTLPTSDPDEIEEARADEGVVAEGDPKPSRNRTRGRNRR